jgi:hypothetical protein
MQLNRASAAGPSRWRLSWSVNEPFQVVTLPWGLMRRMALPSVKNTVPSENHGYWIGLGVRLAAMPHPSTPPQSLTVQ